MAGTTMQQRRGTAAQWATTNPVLKLAEVGFTTDTGIMKVGDGVNNWNALPVFQDSALQRSATDLATPNTPAKRDAFGNAHFNRLFSAVAPSTVDELTRKDYVDAGDAVAAQRPRYSWLQVGTGSSSGQWSKIGTVTLTAQYNETEIALLLVDNGTGNPSAQQARVSIRVKQQAAMASAPIVTVTAQDVRASAGITFSAANFVAITETNTAGSTVVSLWVLNNSTYSAFMAWEEYVVGSQFWAYNSTSPAPLVATAGLPAGVQTTGVNAAVSAATPSTMVIRDAQGSVAFQEVNVNAQTQGGSATRKDYVDGLVTQTGANRALVYHFGSVTTFPTTGVKIGDRCYRTDLVCELYWNGGVWRQVSDARMTKAQRLALLATNDGLYGGFTVIETDTDRRWYWDTLPATPVWQYLSGGKSPKVKLIGANGAPQSGVDTAWSGSWAAPEYDTDGYWDSTNSQVKIPTGLGGIYRSTVVWNTNAIGASTTVVALRLVKLAKAAQTSPPTGVLASGDITGNTTYIMVHWEGALLANDYVSLQIWQNASSSFAAGGANLGAPSYVALDFVSPN